MQAPKDPPDLGPKLPGWAARAIFGSDSVTSDRGALTLGEVPEGHFDGPPNEPLGPPKPQQMLISTQFLSLVLHELAGQASMCWTRPPGGVFDSQRAIQAVEHALQRLSPAGLASRDGGV